MSEFDFTNCPHLTTHAYSGANGKKIAIEFEGSVWMLKFPPSAAEKPNELSYSNSAYSEHIGSTIYRLLGIEAQETRLGTHQNGNRKVVCACKDFTVPGKRLLDFCSIKNSVLESSSGGTGTELPEVLESIEGQHFVDPSTVLERFWEMFVVDAFIGNFDRHNGNWGFLVDDVTGKVSLAPVFDCGSCLLPQADETIMRKVISDEAELKARIYTFPASMLKQGGRKISYCEFFWTSDNPDFRRLLQKLSPRILALDVESLIADTPYLTALQREFLKTYLNARRRELFVRGASKTGGCPECLI